MENRGYLLVPSVRYALFLLPLLLATQTRAVVLDESCIVNVLNRTVPVRPDGGWSMPNIPSFMGQVRARVTCIRDGQTISGQTGFFSVVRNGVTRTGEFAFATPDPAPTSLVFDPTGVAFLAGLNSTADLRVLASFPDNDARDVTAVGSGINYNSSNPAIVSVDVNGKATAVAAGNALITARLDGAVAVKQVTVSTTGDTDGDGLPDDYEERHGLNPNDPIDAHEDQDDDGLSALEEYRDWGTDPREADSDSDGIKDGEEVAAGRDGFITNALNEDTDTDRLWDGLEVQVGSSPVDAEDRNLAAALSSFEISPGTATIKYNTIETEASRQLTVTGHLIDGNTIDLTATSDGTSYTSSDLAICSFGIQSGRVFAGTNGACVVTASNSGFSAETNIVVDTFEPTALGYIGIPGYAYNVDVQGDYAFVAAGAAGLQVVDIADRGAPSIVASVDTPGVAQDVRIVADLAYVADGSAGLQVVDVADPLQPQIIGNVDTPGTAYDVYVKDHLAYVADNSGLQVIDVGFPGSPDIVGSVDTPGTAYGVAVSHDGFVAVVADGTAGIQIVDVSDPTNPGIVGGIDTGDARDVEVSEDFAFVADRQSSLTTVDIASANNPVIRASTPFSSGGRLVDVALIDGFALGADIFFVNGVPIIDVAVPEAPAPRRILNFSQFRDDNGTGIAVDTEHVYLTAAVGSSTRLYIGQYRAIEDTAGIAPQVTLVSPLPGETVIEGVTLDLIAEASDDIAVAAVQFLINGSMLQVDTVEPYEASLVVPADIFGLTVGAEAVDFGGNVGSAHDVIVNVIPDPLTQITGRLVDADGEAVSGAIVSLRVSSQDVLETISDFSGSFSFTDVPTIFGPIRVTASFFGPSDLLLVGASAYAEPVRSGSTNLGLTTLYERIAGDGWRQRGYDNANSARYPFSSTPNTGTPGVLWQKAAVTNATVFTVDLDGNGLLDIVTSNGTSLIAFDGFGNELWSVPTTASLQYVGDLDGDSDPEICLGYRTGGNRLNVDIFSSDGTFDRTLTRGASGYDSSIQVLTNFGDHLIVGYSAGFSRSPRGVGILRYSKATEDSVYLVGGSAWGSFGIGDSDADGLPEVALPYGTPHNGARANGTTDGNLYAVLLEIDTDAEPATLRNKFTRYLGSWNGGTNTNGYDSAMMPDLNGDGVSEPIFLEGHDSRHYRGNNHMYLSDTNGNLLRSWRGDSNAYIPRGAVVNDVSGDGIMDLVISGASVQNIHLVDGADFGEIKSVTGGGQVLGVADIDGDGDDEVVAFLSSAGRLKIFNAEDLSEVSFLDIGGFVPFGTSHSPNRFAISDVTGDRKLELILGTSSGLMVVGLN